MRRKILAVMFGVLSVVFAGKGYAAWTWSPFMEMTGNYFNPLIQGGYDTP